MLYGKEAVNYWLVVNKMKVCFDMLQSVAAGFFTVCVVI